MKTARAENMDRDGARQMDVSAPESRERLMLFAVRHEIAHTIEELDRRLVNLRFLLASIDAELGGP